MTTSVIQFVAHNIPVNVTINQNTTFVDAFNQIKDILNLTEPMSEYVIVNSPFLSFTNQRIVSLGNVNCFYIAKKTDYQIVDQFCKQYMQNLAIEAFRLPVNGPMFLSKMHLMHQMMNHIFDENDSLEVLNYIPFDQLGELSDIPLVEAATKWFHESFFQYLEKPVCHLCGKETQQEQAGAPTVTESGDGAYTVWRYKCPECNAITRFPRYLSPKKLCETHTGQSIEATVLLGSILNSLGFSPRVVCNMEYDRMWLEVFVDSVGSFVHVDPVEGIVDAPFIYEQWGRKCRWMIAVGSHDCTDVTPRYTQNPDEVIEARNEIFPEEPFQQLIGLRNETWKYNADSELVDQESERQMNDTIYAEPRELKEIEKQPQKFGTE